MVGLAAGIEGRPATGAPVLAGEVAVDAHLEAAGPTEHGRLIPFRLRPHLRRMIGECVMALATRMVGPAAAHLDGDDVQGAMVVRTTRFGVERHPLDDRAHGSPCLRALDSGTMRVLSETGSQFSERAPRACRSAGAP